MFNNSEGRECRHLTIIQLVYLVLVLILCHLPHNFGSGKIQVYVYASVCLK